MALIDRLRIRLGESELSDEILDELILTAKEKFIELRYPVSEPPTDESGENVIPSRWDGWIISAAIEIFSKFGAEGQMSHSENGIVRSYQGADLSSDLCSKITPVAGIVRGQQNITQTNGGG